MNYEMQFKLNTGGSWVFWSSTPRLKTSRKRHLELVRGRYLDRKFRIVRVTRKVVAG